MKSKNIGILHYSSPPVVGGVEAVIHAHADLFAQAGCNVTIIAGRGSQEGFEPSVRFIGIAEIDSQHPDIIPISSSLERGHFPPNFEQVSARLELSITPIVSELDFLIIHNIYTKHFNLPLTAALTRMLDHKIIKHGIAWCHDFTWTSPSSRTKVHPGYPWDLLKTKHSALTYVVVSNQRKRELAQLFECTEDQIEVVYNGVDPVNLFGLSNQGRRIIEKLDLIDSDLILLMPVRITQAKNIEYAQQVLAVIKSRGIRARLVVTGPPDPHDEKNMMYYQTLLNNRKLLEIEDDMTFIYESGSDPNCPEIIDNNVVADLFRISDVMFMPSHREGFGMPVLEAGLLGLPILSSGVPAANEIAKNDATLIDTERDPKITASILEEMMQTNPLLRLRRKVRQEYTWSAIFNREIKPLLRNLEQNHG